MRNKKSIIAICSLVAFIVFGAIGVGYAAMSASTNSVENDFELGEIKCEIVESFDGNTKKDVAITHKSGTISAFIRAEIVVTWKDAAGNVYGEAPVLGRDYTMSLNESDWFEGRDGFYYCKSIVGVAESSPVLIYSAAPNAGAAPENFTLSVQIIAQAIQSNPAHAVTDAWPAVKYNGSELTDAPIG